MRAFLNQVLRDHGVHDAQFEAMLTLGHGLEVVAHPSMQVQANMSDQELAATGTRLERQEIPHALGLCSTSAFRACAAAPEATQFLGAAYPVYLPFDMRTSLGYEPYDARLSPPERSPVVALTLANECRASTPNLDVSRVAPHPAASCAQFRAQICLLTRALPYR